MAKMQPSMSKADKLLNPHKSAIRITVTQAYKTIGVVFGGLATSPLYVFPTLNMAQISHEERDFLGVLSIVFWTLTLIGVLKYSFLLLHAHDNNGEGGSFVLYSLIVRRLNTAKSSDDERVSNDSRLASFLQKNKASQRVLFMVAMLGSLMLFGDAVLTPAISVLAAIDGLKNVSPSMSQNEVAMISVVILVALFLVQRFGTERVSLLFSPIMLVWMISNTIIGAFNISSYYPRIFKAILPSYAISFFLQRARLAWVSLIATSLSISGVEAMYADLGHFDKPSMQVAFLFAVYPCCLIIYAGQTAYFIQRPGDCNNHAFYNTIPKPFIWPSIATSTLAAIVASQSMISACFSLVKQLMDLDQFPRVHFFHTSKTRHGQVYSPEVNYSLMVLCAIVVLGFREGSTLGNAFAVTVISVLVVTTLLFAVAMPLVFGLPIALSLLFLTVFGLIEGAYLSAMLFIVPKGGWLPFLITIVAAIVMFSWIYARQKKRQYKAANKLSLEDFGSMVVSMNVRRVPGLCIFFISTLDSIPPFVSHYLKHARSMHQVVVLATVELVPRQTVSEEQRFLFRKAAPHFKGIYLCTAQYGFAQANDVIHLHNFSDCLVKSLEEHVRASTSTVSAIDNNNTVVAEELYEIEFARRDSGAITLFVGRTELVTKEGLGTSHHLFKRLAIDKIYRFLHTNCASPAPFLTKPHSGLVEIGMVLEV